MGADQRFQQRIARQPVGAVQPRAGHLAHGVKPGDLRLAVHVRHHAAALVMRRRHDRDRLLGDVDAVAQAGLVDVRETVDDEPRRLVRDVQQHVIGAALLHLAVNGAGHDVARRQRFERMVLRP